MAYYYGGISVKHFCATEKVIRFVTNQPYKSRTEPIFKGYGLFNVNDMFLLNKKNIHKLFHNSIY